MIGSRVWEYKSSQEGLLVKSVELEVGSSDDRVQPICPHCEKVLTHLTDHRSKFRTLLELHVISCPHCRKVLKVSTLPK